MFDTDNNAYNVDDPLDQMVDNTMVVAMQQK